MALLIITGTFFFFNLFCQLSAEYINDNPDLKLAFQKIEDLQKIMHTQDERISILEKRPPESEVQTVAKLQNTVKQQGYEIAQLKARIKELETVISPAEEDILGEDEPLSGVNEISVASKKSFIRKCTLIIILHIQKHFIKFIYFAEVKMEIQRPPHLYLALSNMLII